MKKLEGKGKDYELSREGWSGMSEPEVAGALQASSDSLAAIEHLLLLFYSTCLSAK